MSVKPFALLCLFLTHAAFVVENTLAQGRLDHVIPARAVFANGEVIVHGISVPSAPFPGITPNANAPQSVPGESHTYFRAGDIQAFHPDGTAVPPATWQSALARETAVLYLGHALVDPNTGAPALRRGVTLSSEEKSIYKPDTLILSGTRSPVRHQSVPNPKVPKGVQPRFGKVLVEANGMIRVTERLDVWLHYYAPLATGGRTHIFQKTTTTTTRTLPATDVRVWTPDGKLIAAPTLPRWLTQEYPALISGDGGEVDPLFLELLNPNTPVVAVPILPPGPPSNAPGPGLLPAPPR